MALTGSEKTALITEFQQSLALKMQSTEVSYDGMISFFCGKSGYLLRPADVASIYPSTGITPLPGAPMWVRGVVNLGGQVMTVLDLNQLVCGEQTNMAATDTQLISLTHGDMVALLVGHVEDLLLNSTLVMNFSESDTKPWLSNQYECAYPKFSGSVIDVAAMLSDPLLTAKGMAQ